MKGLQKLLAIALTLVIPTMTLSAGTVSAAADLRENFQDEAYVVGTDINGVNGWSTEVADVFKTQWDPDPNAAPQTNKVLLASGKQIYKGATKKFDEPITNIGFNNLVEVSFRMWTWQQSGGAGFELRSGDKVVFQAGRAGTDKRGAVFFYPDPAINPTWNEGYLSPVDSYYILRDFVSHEKWHYFRIQIDFNTKKITSYSAEFEITDEMIDKVIAEGDNAVPGLSVVRDLPFTKDADSIDNIRFKLAGWGDSKAAWDDVFAGLTGERINVTNIAVNAPSTEITEDLGTMQMSATVTPENASNTDVTWTVENFINGTKGRATINPNGLLTAVANGTVRVRATARDGSGIYGETDINISGQNENRTIVITSDTGSFNIDEQMGKIKLTSTIPDPNFEGVPIQWSINNVGGKAFIDQTGLVRALENGPVSVTARAEKDDMVLEGSVTINISNQLSYLDTPAFTETFPNREEVFGETRTSGTEGSADGTFEIVPGITPRWTHSGYDWSTVNNMLARHTKGSALHVTGSAGLQPATFRIDQAVKVTADIEWSGLYQSNHQAVSSFTVNGYSLKAQMTSNTTLNLTLTGGGINQTVENLPAGRFLYTFIIEDDGYVSVSRSTTGGDSPVTLFETFAPTPIEYGSSANDIAISAQWLAAYFRDINVYHKDMSAQLEINTSGNATYTTSGNTVTVNVPLDRTDDRSGNVFGSVVVITAVYGADNRMLGVSAQTLEADLFEDGPHTYERVIDVTDGSAVSQVRMSIIRSLNERAPLVSAIDLNRI